MHYRLVMTIGLHIKCFEYLSLYWYYVNGFLVKFWTLVSCCNAPTVHVSLFISLIIYLITTNKSDGQDITTIPKDNPLCTLIKYSMDHLCT